MKRALVIVLTLAAVLGVSTWTWKRNFSMTPSTPHEQPVTWRDQRLNQLRSSLEQLKSAHQNGSTPSKTEIEARINALKERIAQTQSQLEALGADEQAVAANAASATKDRQMSIAEHIADLERQIEILTAQMADTDKRLKKLNRETETEDVGISIEDAQAEYKALSLTRDQLREELAALKVNDESRSVASFQDVKAGQAEISVEVQPLKVQLEDLRADLDYWQTAKAEGSVDLQNARIAELEAKIHALETVR